MDFGVNHPDYVTELAAFLYQTMKEVVSENQIIRTFFS